MGRILFLSAVAFLAYRYIGRSNQRHQPLGAGNKTVEVLPPVPDASSPAGPLSAVESNLQPALTSATISRAAESDPA